MRREDYFKLKNLLENVNLTENEFYQKYKSKFDDDYIYNESNTIKKIDEFRENMIDIKGSINRKEIIL